MPRQGQSGRMEKAIQSVGYDLLTEDTGTGLEDHQRAKYAQLKKRTLWAILFSLPW